MNDFEFGRGVQRSLHATSKHADGPRVFRAPGRVNLIGGQVDYHEGLVVSMATDRDVRVAVSPRDDRRVVAHSAELRGPVDIAADGRDEPAAVRPEWGRVVAGVVRTLADAGREPVGATLAVSSTVPIGAGLSSSAAFEVAIALALDDVAEFAPSTLDLMLAAQRAEHIATGVPCGVQDQMTSLFAVADHALLIDCRALTVEPLPLPTETRVIVIHSGVPRVLERSPYARRRAESLAVAERLGVRALRDATAEQVRDEPRGRHAVSEIRRVQEFATALRTGDLAALGPLMLASHASSRDDMEVSIPELDALVDALMGAGALGARLTGAGFGGCVVALAPADRANRILHDAAGVYATRTGRTPTAWAMTAAAGAGPVAAVP
jgi:galactokinase